MKKIWVLLLLISATNIYAASDFYTLFKDADVCFLLYNVSSKQMVAEYHPQNCKTRISPDPTFYIPLSLMAYDSSLIKKDTIFPWNKQEYGRAGWDEDQTTQSWQEYSVRWVAEFLAAKLGLDKIKKYLKAFDYGNQDFSGDEGQSNALQRAWLESSLKISPNEQLEFLKKLVAGTLPVSQDAISNTQANLYLETSKNGWQLYGKTGTGDPERQIINYKHLLETGWFIGWTQKGEDTYIFVFAIKDTKKPAASTIAGIRARDLARKILPDLGVF